MSFGMGLNFLQTWLSTTFGGITGVLFFYFVSRWAVKLYLKYAAPYLKAKTLQLAGKSEFVHRVVDHPKKPVSNFKGRNRKIVKLIRKFGLAGIVVLTPVVLSIPVGTFVATRYYASNRYLVLYLCASVLFWSLFMSSAFSLF